MNEIIVAVCPDGNGGFQVVDALGRNHNVSDDVALGRLIARLTSDEELPRPRVQKRHQVVGIAAAFARKLLPRHRDLVDAAEPMAHHVTEVVVNNRDKNDRGPPRSVRGDR